MSLHAEIIKESVFRMNENTPRIAKCLAQLNEYQVWQRPNDVSNSIANLILHLCGNITQYIQSSLGGQMDLRMRDLEFESREGFDKAELMAQLNQTVTEAIEVIEQTSEAELLRVRPVQAYQMSGMGCLLHVVEHYSYHTGQIAFYTKLLTASGLGFYDGVDLTRRDQ